MIESIDYKHQDYQVRSQDPYAQTKYRIIMQWLPRQEQLSVLNAGCGSGEMSVLLAQNASWQIDAIDIDPDAVQRSTALNQSLGLTNMRVFQRSIEQHQASQQYDVIVSNDVLEHIDDDVGTIQRLTAMLRPGGLLCISVPALQWLYGYHDQMLGHYRRYNRQRLIESVAPYAHVEKCRYFGATLIPIAFLYSRLLAKPYPVGKQNKTSLVGTILYSLLNIEENIAFPTGTSLLLLASKPVQS